MKKLNKTTILVALLLLLMAACTPNNDTKFKNNQEIPNKPSNIQQEIVDKPEIETSGIVNNTNEKIEDTQNVVPDTKPNVVEDWHHNGKDIVDKSKLPVINYEIQYYGYKSDYAKLYKLIPNININSHDGVTTVKCVYCESISKSDTFRVLDLLIGVILNIPKEQVTTVEEESCVIYNIPFDVFNEHYTEFIKQLDNINNYGNDLVRKVRYTNNKSEIHVYLNQVLEGRPNEAIDLEIRTLVYLEVYNLINFYSSNNLDSVYSQKVKIFELDSKSTFLNSVTYSIVDYSDYNGIWTGFDNIGHDTFYPILLDNIIITPVESDKIKIGMPTNLSGYTQEYLSRFYISLFEFFPTDSSLYSDYQNTLYCYLTKEEYAKITDIIYDEKEEFISKHLNISGIEYINNTAKFTVTDTNFRDTNSDYYQYLTIEILNNKFDIAKEDDISIYKILVCGQNGEIKTIIKCNTKSNEPLMIVELDKLVYGDNSEKAINYFNKLVMARETLGSFEFTLSPGIESIIENCIRTQLENEDTEFKFEVDFENTSIQDMLAVINYIDTYNNGVISLEDNKICLTLDKTSFEYTKKHIDNEVKDVLKNSYVNRSDFTESIDRNKADVYGYRLLAELMECINIKPNVDIN